MKTTHSSDNSMDIFKSEHFTLHPLADGVFAAIATELGAGFSNAGLIDLGDKTLVFDSFENPQAAEDLLQASIQLTQHKPETIMISHWHPDHWGGLQVFAGCTILANQATRQAMVPVAKEMAEAKQDASWIAHELQEAETRLAVETDPHQRHTLQLAMARQRHHLQSLAALNPTLPNQTFNGKIVFHGTVRSAELISTGEGHTKSDCILLLPEDRIAFIGDIGFFQSQPFMAYGFPLEWATLLDDMAGWKAKTFVPGHGPIGSKADLVLEAQYIRTLEDMVEKVILGGGKLKDALRQTLPSPFDAWQTTGQRFDANVRSSFKRQRRQINANKKAF